MTTYLPGPYEVEFNIRVSGVLHRQRINCSVVGTPAVGTAPSLVSVNTRDGGTLPLSTVTANWWSFLRTVYHTGVVCEGYTLWKFVPGTLQKDFVTQGTMLTPAGTHATTPQLARQETLTFRSGLGNIVKLVLLELSIQDDLVAALIADGAGNSYQRIAAYWLSSAGWMIGRDDSFVIAPLRVAGTQNESVYRKRYRAL